MINRRNDIAQGWQFCSPIALEKEREKRKKSITTRGIRIWSPIQVVHVLQTTQNWSFHVVVLQRTAKKCTKNYNASAEPLFFSLDLLFSDVPVAVAVVVILNSLVTLGWTHFFLICKMRKGIEKNI